MIRYIVAGLQDYTGRWNIHTSNNLRSEAILKDEEKSKGVAIVIIST